MSKVQSTLFDLFDKQKVCKGCETIFEFPEHKHATRYCSADCRKQHHAKKTEADRACVCKGCNVEFIRPSRRGSGAIYYCSKSCRVKIANEKRRIKATVREGACIICSQAFTYSVGRGSDGRKTCSVPCKRKLITITWEARKARAPKCNTDGCNNKCARPSYGLCEACYMRLWRNGTVETISKKGRSTYRRHEGGYVMVNKPDHPLSTSNGYVSEHRMVMYDHHGKGPHPCYWCGKVLEWKRICIDHLNEKKDDNRLDNLVLSCRRCNEARGSIVPFMQHMRPEAFQTFIRVMAPAPRKRITLKRNLVAQKPAPTERA